MNCFAAPSVRTLPPAAVKAEPSQFSKAIHRFGGRVVDPSQFPENLEGFQRYLAASGVHAFNAAELTRPYQPDIASRLGFASLLPPQAWWPRGAALALVAQDIEDLVGERVAVRHWWRPVAYNRDPGVHGAQHSDHIAAFAMDLDYASSRARRTAEQWLRRVAARDPWLQLSLGLGNRTTHVGLLSPRGRREWHYASYVR